MIKSNSNPNNIVLYQVGGGASGASNGGGNGSGGGGGSNKRGKNPSIKNSNNSNLELPVCANDVNCGCADVNHGGGSGKSTVPS